MTCTARSGFLTLRDCGNPAVGSCSECGRSLCMEHLAGTRCLDCTSRSVGGEPTAFDNDDYAYRYRRWYYGQSHYRPIYDGRNPGDPYYDDYDFRSFDAAGIEDTEGDDDEAKRRRFDES